MKSFGTILQEAALAKQKAKMSGDVEDNILTAGSEGYTHALKTLHAISNSMQGKGSDAYISKEHNSSSSIVFGHHPETGKFFVASKSAIGAANPKLSYTADDVERNHGHAPGVAEKLKSALRHLPKVAPEKGIYHGNIMHSGMKDVKKSGGDYNFTPGKVTYTTQQSSPEGRKVSSSKMGLVVTAQYKGSDFQSLKPSPTPNVKSFKEHPDVHMMSSEVDATQSHFDKKTMQSFDQHMAAADASHKKLTKGGYEALTRHSEMLKKYIDQTIKKNKPTTTAGFKKYMEDRGNKDMEKLQTKAGKATRLRAHNLTLQQIDQDKKHISNAIELHSHLRQAKNTLVHALVPAASAGYKVSELDNNLNVTLDGHTTKLRDRSATY